MIMIAVTMFHYPASGSTLKSMHKQSIRVTKLAFDSCYSA